MAKKASEVIMLPLLLNQKAKTIVSDPISRIANASPPFS